MEANQCAYTTNQRTRHVALSTSRVLNTRNILHKRTQSAVNKRSSTIHIWDHVPDIYDQTKSLTYPWSCLIYGSIFLYEGEPVYLYNQPMNTPCGTICKPSFEHQKHFPQKDAIGSQQTGHHRGYMRSCTRYLWSNKEFGLSMELANARQYTVLGGWGASVGRATLLMGHTELTVISEPPQT